MKLQSWASLPLDSQEVQEYELSFPNTDLGSCSWLLRQALWTSVICVQVPGRQWGYSPQLKAAEKDCDPGMVVGSRGHTWNVSPQTDPWALL